MNFLPFDGAKLCDFLRNNIILCYIYFADCYAKVFLSGQGPCPDKKEGYCRASATDA
jgi:hypothetical protein